MATKCNANRSCQNLLMLFPHILLFHNWCNIGIFPNSYCNWNVFWYSMFIVWNLQTISEGGILTSGEVSWFWKHVRHFQILVPRSAHYLCSIFSHSPQKIYQPSLARGAYMGSFSQPQQILAAAQKTKQKICELHEEVLLPFKQTLVLFDPKI